MKSRLSLLLLSAVGFCLGLNGSAYAASIAGIIKKISPSVVVIGTHQKARFPPDKFLGTGFSVGTNLIVTADHVIPKLLDTSRKEVVSVYTGSADSINRREVLRVFQDNKHDIAVLHISGEPLPAMEFADTALVQAGDEIAFTGFPIGQILGVYPVTHRGIISAISPIAIPTTAGAQVLDVKMIRQLRDPYDIFQLDAVAYPGNSGGPLYDPVNGKVIGVINMVFVKGSKEKVLQDPSGISYAIPGHYAEALVNKARKALKIP